jgi:uncharacterized coiled-coil DUF342 family protein
MTRSQTRAEEVKKQITSYERKIQTRKARIMELDAETRQFKIYLHNLRDELFNIEGQKR